MLKESLLGSDLYLTEPGQTAGYHIQFVISDKALKHLNHIWSVILEKYRIVSREMNTHDHITCPLSSYQACARELDCISCVGCMRGLV